jgi:photosystem II stability/assembly factor-like uncharacterized protein
MVLAAPTELSWMPLGGPPGGLGYDIRYNFANPNTWYVTDAFAGLFISTDNGFLWEPSNSGIPPQLGPTGDDIPVFSLTVDPINPQIVWCGTDLTGHVYKSLDGGLTWVEKDNGISYDGYDSFSLRGFTVDPFDSDTVYAMGELKKEELGGTSIWGLGIGGRVYKTTDGGDNWQLIWDGGVPSSLTRYMWINPRDPENLNDDTLFVSTGIFDRGAVGEPDGYVVPPGEDPFGGLGILRSHDSGQTWEFLDKDNGLEMLYIGSLYMHPEDPDLLLAAAGHILTPESMEAILEEGEAPGGVYRTVDGGNTWTKVLISSGDLLLEQLSAVEICADPYDHVAYAGSNMAIYRSDDFGQNWRVVSAGWGPPGVDVGWPIDLQCDPRDPNRIFANNYGGGNFLSEDGGSSWQNASQGYTGAQMRDIAVDPSAPARLYAAGRTGMWRTDTAGNSWIGISFPASEVINSADFAAVAVDPVFPRHVFTGNAVGAIQESYDRGSTWHHVWPPLVNNEHAFNVTSVSDLVFAPSDPSWMYASFSDAGCTLLHDPCFLGFGVAVSQDGGKNWALSSDADMVSLPVIDLAVHPSDPMRVFAGSAAGLYVTNDGGVTWERVSITGQPEDARVRAVAFNPLDGDRILAAVDGEYATPGSIPGIFLSTDGGSTWQASYAGLEPNSSIHNILFSPVDAQTVFTSDYLSGIYRSSDGGQTWVLLNTGMHTRAAGPLSFSTDGLHLYLGTNGNGVYRLDLNSLPPEPVPPDHLIMLPLVRR